MRFSFVFTCISSWFTHLYYFLLGPAFIPSIFVFYLLFFHAIFFCFFTWISSWFTLLYFFLLDHAFVFNYICLNSTLRSSMSSMRSSFVLPEFHYFNRLYCFRLVPTFISSISHFQLSFPSSVVSLVFSGVTSWSTHLCYFSISSYFYFVYIWVYSHVLLLCVCHLLVHDFNLRCDFDQLLHLFRLYV